MKKKLKTGLLGYFQNFYVMKTIYIVLIILTILIMNINFSCLYSDFKKRLNP